MAKRKIIWSHKARIKLTEILDYYYERNKSKTYSIRLQKEIQKSIRLLVKQPSLGIKTDDQSIRALIIGDYIIFYESAKDQIIIHSLWDCRQNPEDIILK
jgi:plasmid stabilization system protein ParE